MVVGLGVQARKEFPEILQNEVAVKVQEDVPRGTNWKKSSIIPRSTKGFGVVVKV